MRNIISLGVENLNLEGVRHCDSLDDCLQCLDSSDSHILLLGLSLGVDEAKKAAIAVRQASENKPLQIILIGNAAQKDVSDVLGAGVDDYLRSPVDTLELEVRLDMAAHRLASQEKLIQERGYFLQAVKGEEALSSMALDQNLALKRVVEKVTSENQRLRDSNKTLEKLASIDPLSGLLNRLGLFVHLDEVVRRAREGMNLCGVMIDIDHFKEINDNFGHLVGDEVIRAVGRILLGQLRKRDVPGRYGGEEFFVILPDTMFAEAARIAERFRQALQEEVFQTGIRVTASLGVAEFRVGETRDQWLSRADVAMYAAKQRGRNRVVIEQDQRLEEYSGKSS